MTDDPIRLAAQAVADALNSEKCIACGASLRTPACWKRDKIPHGEYCLLGEGRDGEHTNIMGGWRWTKCAPPVAGVLCGASGPGSVFGDGCTFLANHDGPHSFSPPSHNDGCALVALRRALAEHAEERIPTCASGGDCYAPGGCAYNEPSPPLAPPDDPPDARLAAAAYAAAYDAAYDAAYAAGAAYDAGAYARTESLARCADLVRARISVEAVRAALGEP